jgi:hypothetical protein
MASPAANKGDGSSIAFETGFFAQITDINWSGVTRASIPLPHMGLAAASSGTFGNLPKVPGNIIDPGALEVEINFNPDTTPPIGAAASTCTVTFAGGATWAGSAFMTEMGVAVPMGKVMSQRVKIEFSGAITMTDAT